MKMKISKDELRRLSVAERIQLVEDIWDSIAEEGQEIPLTDSQKRELDRRLQEHSKNPEVGRTWDEVRESLD